MNAIIRRLQQDIAKVDRPENRINYQQFFKEKLENPTGLKSAVLQRVSKERFKNDIKGRPKKAVLDLCDEILASGMRYGPFFAFEWASKLQKEFAVGDFPRFQRWLKRYVDNWGKCDHLCGAVLGPLVLKYPDLVARTHKWEMSKSRWLRRAAAVTLIVPVRNRALLDEVFKVAEVLLKDEDDMVQKGYGWMLKEASNKFPNEVFAYVMKHRNEMPRTALRCAIEKYPQAKRKKAMG